MKNSDRFTNLAEAYNSYRPHYSEDVIDHIIKWSGIPDDGSVVDLGSGTGISTEPFILRGYQVTGVEPNLSMHQFEDLPYGANYIRANAETVPLPRRSVDLIVSAQSFHWFDIRDVLYEVSRLLKPGGTLAVFWNIRHRDEFTRAYNDLVVSMSPDYRDISKPLDTIYNIIQIAQSEISEHVITRYPIDDLLDISQTFDKDSLIRRAYTSSYVAKADMDHEKFKQKLSKLFDKYKVDNEVTIYYECLLFLAKFRGDN